MPAYVSSTVMRPMPNLENLKKQAKLYLRWHRDRYYPVAARIRAVLPSYRHLSDVEVLAHSFRLSDAQELIDLVKARKGSAHAPKHIKFVSELPMTGVGKVDKKVLKAGFWVGRERMVG